MPSPSYIILIALAIAALSYRSAEGQSIDTTFRIIPERSISELRSMAAVSVPPQEEGEFREPDLVDLASLDAPLKLDIRYASADNFMGAVFYASSRAFLQRPAAAALEEAALDLSKKGFGVIVFDGYRPWFVTKMFWEATPDSLKHFVAPPGSGSRHNRGAAVDVGLYDLDTGAPVAMPSGYDEFTERAYAAYQGGSEAARRHRDLLRRVMESHGFAINPTEWWHFDHEEWREYPIMNLTFEEID
jgi:D-alanyl-D-alanine dipeptidase